MFIPKKIHKNNLSIYFTVIILFFSTGISPAYSAQVFNSGSTGADGALNLTTPGTILFDPASFTPPLDADGDGVYHFTTINIASGVTVRLAANILGTTPVVWLARGNVQIDGTLDLSGEKGHDADKAFVPSIAGAGGFGGGVGASSPTTLPTSGNGPGGGGSGVSLDGGGAGHATPGSNPRGVPIGKAYGNDFLMPLLGGSGGAGGAFSQHVDNPTLGQGSGGGAGGGAILIASSTEITIVGKVSAFGGFAGVPDEPALRRLLFHSNPSVSPGFSGGGGNGVSIRLIAPNIRVVGSLSAQGERSITTSFPGSNGRIRLEAFIHHITGTITPAAGIVAPGIVFPPAGAPFVRVTQVAGTPVPAKTRAASNPADLTINEGGPVTLQIEAHNIPLGTVIKLRMTSETNGLVEFDSTPLAGSLATSTATATSTIPHAFSRFTVEATWTP